MPFPLAKLLALGLRQMSRHVAAFVKTKAKENETFRSILVRSAGWYHGVSVRSSLANLGFGKVKDVQPLSEQAAIELGAEMINDLVVICCALSIYLFIESIPNPSQRAEAERKKEEMDVLKKAVYQQSVELEEQAVRLKELEKLLTSKTMYSSTTSKVIKDLKEIEIKSLSDITNKKS
ncbi:optic atrophy 3 protein homolog [Mya arenaria]|uniref:optic atrophy 3 protein homolog n=1 Tax=Mya arenaria TaxID=6604 RepID=UPI0022E7FF4F|nr:optic atrophy 3 protein homolog [Mya arenaria]